MPPVFTLPPFLPEINIIEEIPQALILPQPSIPEPAQAIAAQSIAAQSIAAQSIARPMQIQAKPVVHSSIKYGKMFGF